MRRLVCENLEGIIIWKITDYMYETNGIVL